MTPLKALSLFTGIGGLELGLIEAGLANCIEPKLMVEIDSFCCKVLTRNFPAIAIHHDVRQLSIQPRQFDIIYGGFPCQPHSQAGKKQGNQDTRDLTPEILRLIQEGQPKAILLENVPGLRTTERGIFFKRLVGTIAILGYDLEWGCTTAAAVGAVHRRKRMWILAYAQSVSPRNSSFSQIWPNNTFSTGTVVRNAAMCQNQSSVCCWHDGISQRLAGALTTFDCLDLNQSWDCEIDPWRRDKLKALGNAVCPQQVAIIWKRFWSKL